MKTSPAMWWTRQSIARLVAAFLSMVCILALGTSLPLPPAVRAQMDATLQMTQGNPDYSEAGRDIRQRLLIQRPQYALDYDDSLHFPVWVGWHLSRQDLGSVGRGVFVPDTSVAKAGYAVVTPSDYTRSGYDRGHNCPSANRTATVADNNAVFLMTNIMPQAHGMNAGPWEKLEFYCRQLAQSGNDLFIYCGHGFSSPTHGTIGPNKIAVPDFGWKIVVVVPPGAKPSGSHDPRDAISHITGATRVIAVRMLNINTVSKKDWREYRVSVGEMEKAMGLKFFDALPKVTPTVIKDRVDFDQSAPSRMVSTPMANPVTNGGAPVTSGNGAPITSGTAAPANPSDVWVNTRSGAYWRPGTRYYGKTKQGKYMNEGDAIKAGYHAANGQ